MSDREIRVVIVAFLSFCFVAGGAIVYTVMQDSKSPLIAASEQPRAPSRAEHPQEETQVFPDSSIQADPEPQPQPELQSQLQPQPTPIAVTHVRKICNELKISDEDRIAGEGLISAAGGEWEASTSDQRTVCCLLIAARTLPDADKVTITAYGATMKTWLQKFRESQQADSTAELAAIISTLDQEAFEKDVRRVAAELTKRLAGKVIVAELLRRENEEAGVILHVRVTNETDSAISFIKLQAELRGLTNDYIDSEDVIIEKLPANDSVVVKLHTDVHPERFERAQLSLLGKHAEEFLLEVR